MVSKHLVHWTKEFSNLSVIFDIPLTQDERNCREGKAHKRQPVEPKRAVEAPIAFVDASAGLHRFRPIFNKTASVFDFQGRNRCFEMIALRNFADSKNSNIAALRVSDEGKQDIGD